MMFDTHAVGAGRSCRKASCARSASPPQRACRSCRTLPAIAETLPGFDVTSWLGIMVPAGTPLEIRSKISAELEGFLQEPAVVAAVQGTRGRGREQYAGGVRGLRQTKTTTSGSASSGTPESNWR